MSQDIAGLDDPQNYTFLPLDNVLYSGICQNVILLLLLCTHHSYCSHSPHPGLPHKPFSTGSITRLCPLRETNGEFRPVRIQLPFFMLDLKQIKQDFDPDKYIKGFQAFDLTWRDITVILSQTLADTERQWVTENTRAFGNDLHITKLYILWVLQLSQLSTLNGIMMNQLAVGRVIT